MQHNNIKLTPIPNTKRYLLTIFLFNLVVVIVPKAIIVVPKVDTIEYYAELFPYLSKVWGIKYDKLLVKIYKKIFDITISNTGYFINFIGNIGFFTFVSI